VNAAGVCKTSVAEYYQTKGFLPANTSDAGCSTDGTANSKAPVVAAGDILVTAAGGLLAQVGSGTADFHYVPQCASAGTAATCATTTGTNAAPIVAWSCDNSTAKTSIPTRYLPAICRG
jgi:type IV pilus assembly protein PilA